MLKKKQLAHAPGHMGSFRLSKSMAMKEEKRLNRKPREMKVGAEGLSRLSWAQRVQDSVQALLHVTPLWNFGGVKQVRRGYLSTLGRATEVHTLVPASLDPGKDDEPALLGVPVAAGPQDFRLHRCMTLCTDDPAQADYKHTAPPASNNMRTSSHHSPMRISSHCLHLQAKEAPKMPKAKAAPMKKKSAKMEGPAKRAKKAAPKKMKA